MASRRKKKLKIYEQEAPKDRLSDLPDSLLLHILSFLPETRWSVRTCVLSKRWKCLWASLPDLKFRGEWGRFPLFNKYVRKVLSGRNNLPLRKFCFVYPGFEKSLVNRVINYAISHNVQHFSINLEEPSLKILFPLFNSCRSLKTLELIKFEDLKLLSDISLPTLTTLHISSSTFYHYYVESNDSVDLDPFVGLVNLKSLKLISVRFRMVRDGVFKISGPQLHSLTLCGSLNYSLGTVEIFAPKLHSFEFIDAYPVEFSNLDFPHLKIANVDVRLTYCKEESHFHLIDMFRGLYNVKSLYLSSRTIKSLMKYPAVLEDQASPFVRLKTLNVKSCCKRVSIPNTVMNYFGHGSTSGLNLSIEIEEKNKWQEYWKLEERGVLDLLDK